MIKSIPSLIFQFLLFIISISLLVACSGDATLTNKAPTVSNVGIIDDNAGNAEVGDNLTGSYTYNDVENDGEGTSTYRWLRNGIAISSATSTSYTLVIADSDQSISFEVTPVAKMGTLTGTAVTSSDTIILSVFSATYCDGSTVGGNCTLSIVKVPDFVNVLCVDSVGDIVCPTAVETYFGQDGNFSIDPESYNLETLNGTKVVESVSGLSWTQAAYAAESLPLAMDQCSSLASSNYADINDWRVPTIRELSRIISKGSIGRAWPTDMENPQNSFWWTLTPAKNDSGMSIGMSGNWPWTYLLPTDGSGTSFAGARLTYCVSGSTMAGVWGVNLDGVTVTHTVTGLIWQRAPSISSFDWDAGLQYCEDSTVGSFNDWRLPTLREYISVLNFDDGTEYMSAAFEGVLDVNMLTSTPNRYGATYTEVAYVNESTGAVRQQNVSSLVGPVRCVRGPIN